MRALTDLSRIDTKKFSAQGRYVLHHAMENLRQELKEDAEELRSLMGLAQTAEVRDLLGAEVTKISEALTGKTAATTNDTATTTRITQTTTAAII